MLLIPLLSAEFLSCSSKEETAGIAINHTAIYVTNVDATAAFYHDIIGLDTIPEPFHDGKHAWFSLGKGVALHVIEGADQPREYFKNQHTCLSVSSVDIFIDKLKANGIRWEDRDGAEMQFTVRVDGVKQIWLQDPDGYWIEINDARD